MHLLPAWLNLDACSIIRLATVVLALAIATYLLTRRGKSRATLFLGLAFCGAAAFDLSSLLEFSRRYYWQPRTLKNLAVPLLQQVGPSLALISLLLFAYFYPRLPRRQRGEARLVVGSALVVAAVMLALTVYNFLFLQWRLSRFDFTMTYYILLYASFGAQVLLLVLLLLRRTVFLSGEKFRPWWARLARPVGKHAATARALALNMLLPGVAVLGYVLIAYGLLPLAPATYLVWLAFLLFHFSFVVTYLNRAAEAATFQVKLTGLALIPVLALLGLMAVFVGSYTETDYSARRLVPSGRSFRFTPNASESYDIEEAPYTMDMQLGGRLEIEHEGMASVDTQFPFPFFGRPYRRIHVLHGPMIYLGERLAEDGWGGYRPNPAIAPVIMNLDPSRGGGVFANSRPQSLTITWFALPELSLPNENTVQLVLRSDGSFTMCFARVDPRGRYASVQMYNSTTANTTGRDPGSLSTTSAFGARLTGIHPGGNAPLRPLRFSRDLPYSSPAPEVIFESYEAGFGVYLHDRMAVLALILLCSALLILFLFPLLFRANLIRPLHALAQGMGRADAGDLDVKVRPHFGDEIGFLTRCFNRMLHSIKKHEAGLRTVAESIQEGMLILQDGAPVYVNRRMCEITGWSREDLQDPASLGLPGPHSEPVDPGEEQPLEGLLLSKADTGVPVELTRAETLWHGKPAQVIVVRDISLRKSREERARQRDQRLVQTNKLTTLGVLLSAMAHQLTTPGRSILHDVSVLNKACPALASILESLGPESSELLIAGLPIPEFRRTLPEILGEIERNARRIEGIVRELQSFGREDPFPVLTSMDVNAVLRSAVELTSGQLKQATERFCLELAPQLPPVRGSARLMEQVVVNLLLNACQALSDRGQAIALRSRPGEDGRTVLVEVQDQGGGIPAENIGRLGERFYTTRRAAGGTGLGVYIAKNILAQHGGSLAFSSERGCGTLAVVALPAEET